MFFSFFYNRAVEIDRRVHITKTTLGYLDDKFEVEPGNGPSREQYLADHKVETYLILPPKVKKAQIQKTAVNYVASASVKRLEGQEKKFLNYLFAHLTKRKVEDSVEEN